MSATVPPMGQLDLAGPLLVEALEARNEGLIAYDGSGALIYSTPRMHQLLGLPSAEGAPLTPSGIETVQGSAVRSLLDEKLSFPLLVRSTAGGTERILRIHHDPPRRVFRVEDLGTGGEERGQERNLLDIVAHDLRAGLVPIKTYAQMLSGGVLGALNEKQTDALKAIDRCVQKQVEKIGSLLDMIKVYEQRLEIQREPLTVRELLQRVVEGIERECARKRIALGIALEDGAAMVDGDAPRLERIFGVLLGRAVRQTPGGGAMGLELRYPRTGVARIRIWDTGPGARAHEVRLLRQSGPEQLAGCPSDTSELDVDLASIHDIVAAHGGSISVLTETDAGTTCLIELPVQRRVPVSVPARPRDVLLIGADGSADAWSKAWREAGWNPVPVASAPQALAANRRADFPAVAVLGGVADPGRLVESLRAERPDLPVAAVLVLLPEAPVSAFGRGNHVWTVTPGELPAGMANIVREISAAVGAQ